MKRFGAFFFAAFAVACTAVWLGNRPTSAQAQAGQGSGIPQPRIVTTSPVIQGMLVQGAACVPANALARCIQPITGDPVAGVASASGTVGSSIGVYMNGQAFTLFSNAPIAGDLVGFDPANPGYGLDLGTAVRASLCNTFPLAGSITAIVSTSPPYSANVTLLGPGSHGTKICAASMDASTMPAYVKSVQDTSTGPTGPQGVQGVQGNTGPTGAMGLMGNQGATGATGAQGVAGPAGSTGASGGVGPTGATGTQGVAGINGTNGSTGATGPSGAVLIGTCSVTQTAVVAINAGPRTVSSTCSTVVSGGYYFLAETAASLTAYPGYGLFAGGTGTATNTLQVTLYGPLLAIGANYTISFAVYKIG